MRPTDLALASAIATLAWLVAGCADLVNTGSTGHTPESMCAALGGRVDVEGKLVGSVATGGRPYRCFDPNDPLFLARKSEDARVARAQAKETARAAQAQAADEALRATRAREGTAAQVAADSCAAGVRPSLCANEDATRARACLEACIAAIEVRQQSAAANAEGSCESRLSDGKAPITAITCGLATLPHASKKLGPGALLLLGRSLLLVDDFDIFVQGGDSLLGRALDKVGGSGTTQALRQELTNGAPWDKTVLDAAFAQWIPLVVRLREAACTERCEEHARAAREAPGLVRAYKLCMVAADSTLEARRLQAYETTLYREFLEHADSKCRAGSRCDWLEGFSTARCTYDSP